MSALKVNNVCKYKNIIKNTLKVQSYEEFEHCFNSSSNTFIRHKLLQSKGKIHKSISNPVLNIHLIDNNKCNNYSFSDDKSKTHRNLNKVLKYDKKIKRKIITLAKVNTEAKKVNNEYYCLPLVEQHTHKKHQERNNSMDGIIQRMKKDNGDNITFKRNTSFVAHNKNNSFFKCSNNNNNSFSNSSNNILVINVPHKNHIRSHNKYLQCSKVKSDSFDKGETSYYTLNNNNNNNNNHNSMLSPLIKHNANNNNNSNNKCKYVLHSAKYRTVLTKYSCKSKAGHNISGNTKKNQDNWFAKNRVFGLSNFSIFAVFDGHGVNGHCVSKFLKEHFTHFFSTKEHFITNLQHDFTITETYLYTKLTNDYFIKQMCNTADERLRKQKFDTKLSGSTGVFIIHIEDKLLCYNIGDSRAIYINSKYEAVQISKDHKPNLPDEQKRILNSGGRVAKVPNTANIGPFRVWLKNEDLPGLAMSRSFGDFVAKSV